MKTLQLFLMATCLVSLASACRCQDTDQGFLLNPPVFIDNEPDIPLTLMGTEVPAPKQIVPGFDTLTQSSTEFRQNGVNVQPGMNVRFDVSRISLLGGVAKDWAAAASFPWQRTRFTGTLGGLPASRDITDIGDFSIFAKKRVWEGNLDNSVVITGGLEFPTGNSTAKFDQSNPATNGYYHSFPQRMPLGWEPGGGTINGLVAAAYRRSFGRVSYSALLAGKLHSSGDEDVKIGDTFIAALCGTYGIAKPAAFSCTLLLRSQANDSYPQAPPPGVNSPILAGTTLHGTTFYVSPSLRLIIGNKVVIGAGVKIPAVLPDDGFVPDTRGFIIIYPKQ